MTPETTMAGLSGQLFAVVRIEIAKTFFSRRSLWIYLLALLPAALFFMNSIYAKREHARLAKIAIEHPVEKEALRSIRNGARLEDVVGLLGEPYRKTTYGFWSGQPPQRHERLVYFYTDGQVDVTLYFIDGVMRRTGQSGASQTLNQLLLVFANVFELYFLRLAIFFGCAGIFTNLFRGEMLDKSLHFYLLSPVPRPVIVAGKYVAGLLATAVIFSVSTALQFYAMFRGFDGEVVHEYLQSNGWSQIAAYMGVSMLACAAYGSIFLAAGLVAKNPTTIAALLLLWESVNAFIPGNLKMASIVFYLQSLCPIEPPPDMTIPPMLRSLVAPAESVDAFTGIAALAVISVLVLIASGIYSRKLEINYSAD